MREDSNRFAVRYHGVRYGSGPHSTCVNGPNPAHLFDQPTPILFDEWQVNPELWNHVRRAVDDSDRDRGLTVPDLMQRIVIGGLPDQLDAEESETRGWVEDYLRRDSLVFIAHPEITPRVHRMVSESLTGP